MPVRKAPVQISNHALFRWMERSGVIDADRLRSALSLSLDRAYQAGAAIGVEEFLILGGGMVFVVRGDTVVTVVEEDDRHRRAHLVMSAVTNRDKSE